MNFSPSLALCFQLQTETKSIENEVTRVSYKSLTGQHHVVLHITRAQLHRAEAAQGDFLPSWGLCCP